MNRNLEPYNIVKSNLTVRLTDSNIITRGNVDLFNRKLTTLPHFKYVGRYFNCRNNKLTSLKGCPIYVGRLVCDRNCLTSLEYCPTYIGSTLYCRYNQLTSLDGCATYIGDSLYCYGNKVKLSRPKGVKIGGEFINV